MILVFIGAFNVEKYRFSVSIVLELVLIDWNNCNNQDIIKQKNDKTTRIRAKPWMFRLPFKVLWSSNNIKKLIVRKN